MIFKEDLQDLTRLSGFKLWQTEKDYLQHIFLFFLSQETKRELVFKGGTALQKVYGLNRFSIDLDFTSDEKDETNIENISKDMSDFGCETRISKVEGFKEMGRTIVLKVKGPLYDGTERALTTLRVEISLRGDLILEPEIKEVVPIYPDLKPYLMLVMRLEEILAEKVRALFWRTTAKDAYDIWFLLRKNVPVELNLINKKLAYYKMEFSIKGLKGKLGDTRRVWGNDLKQVVTFVPDFDRTINEILERFKNV